MIICIIKDTLSLSSIMCNKIKFRTPVQIITRTEDGPIGSLDENQNFESTKEKTERSLILQSSDLLLVPSSC